MAGSSGGVQRTEELFRAAAAGSVRAGARTGPANSTLRTATRVTSSSYSRRLHISNQENKEEKPFSFGPVPTKAEAEDALSALQRDMRISFKETFKLVLCSLGCRSSFSSAHHGTIQGLLTRRIDLNS